MTDRINHPQPPNPPFAGTEELTQKGEPLRPQLPQRHPSAPVSPAPTESHQDRPNGSGQVRTLPTAGTGISVAGGTAVEIAGKPVGYHNMIQAYIFGELVPEWERLFTQRNNGYGDGHRELGIKAQYVDIHRKVSKLRRAWWDGADTSDWNEQPREILLDLIGHCFLAIHLLDEEGEGDGKAS